MTADCSFDLQLFKTNCYEHFSANFSKSREARKLDSLKIVLCSFFYFRAFCVKPSCQKVQKSDFWIQFSMSKLIWIFQNYEPFCQSVQEACAKCFSVHILKFEILQITWHKHQTLSFQFFTDRFNILMFFVLFFHVVFKISNFNK